MLHNIDNAQLFARGESNWDYYVDYPWADAPNKAAIWFVAKPGRADVDSGYMGDLGHIKKLLRLGYWQENTLTALARELLFGVS